MSKMTVRICDYCHSTEPLEAGTSSDALPEGWITVHLPGAHNGDSRRELCGNRCLKDLGRDRMRAERDLDTETSLRSDKIRPAQMGGFASAHKRFHSHKRSAKCPFCAEEAEAA